MRLSETLGFDSIEVALVEKMNNYWKVLPIEKKLEAIMYLERESEVDGS